jgi:hypothetical protein
MDIRLDHEIKSKTQETRLKKQEPFPVTPTSKIAMMGFSIFISQFFGMNFD